MKAVSFFICIFAVQRTIFKFESNNNDCSYSEAILNTYIMQQPKGKTKKKEPVEMCLDSELGFVPCGEVDRIRAEEKKKEYKRKEKEIKLKEEENKKYYEYISTHPLDQRYPTETVYGSFDGDGNFIETTKWDYEHNNPMETRGLSASPKYEKLTIHEARAKSRDILNRKEHAENQSIDDEWDSKHKYDTAKLFMESLIAANSAYGLAAYGIGAANSGINYATNIAANANRYSRPVVAAAKAVRSLSNNAPRITSFIQNPTTQSIAAKTGVGSETLDLGINTYQAIGDINDGNYKGATYNGIQGASNIGSFIGASDALRAFGRNGRWADRLLDFTTRGVMGVNDIVDGVNNIEDINEAKAAAEMKKQQELQELREKYDIFRNNVSLQFR